MAALYEAVEIGLVTRLPKIGQFPKFELEDPGYCRQPAWLVNNSEISQSVQFSGFTQKSQPTHAIIINRRGIVVGFTPLKEGG